MSNDIYKDLALELEAAQKKINEQEALIARLKEVIVDNELEDEIDIDCTSVEEQICINGIRYIAELVESQSFDQNDVKNFDVLLKNLRMIRGQMVPEKGKNKKSKPADILELTKIAKGE